MRILLEGAVYYLRIVGTAVDGAVLEDYVGIRKINRSAGIMKP